VEQGCSSAALGSGRARGGVAASAALPASAQARRRGEEGNKQ
jgi:hypothetical protein